MVIRNNGLRNRNVSETDNVSIERIVQLGQQGDHF